MPSQLPKRQQIAGQVKSAVVQVSHHTDRRGWTEGAELGCTSHSGRYALAQTDRVSSVPEELFRCIVSEQFNPGRPNKRVPIPGQQKMLDVFANVFIGETICRQEFSYHREFISAGHGEGDSVRWC